METQTGFTKKRWHADSLLAIALDPASNQLAYAEGPDYSAKFVDGRKIMSVTVYEDQRSITHANRGRQIGAAYVGHKVAGQAGAIIGGLGARQHSEDVVRRVTLRIELEDSTKPVIDIDFLTAAAPRGSVYHERANQEARTWSSLITAMMRATEAGKEIEPSVSDGPGESRLEQLTKLGQLRDSGVLTQAEFDQEKARILGR
ncbi:SHOCT domain-containing protein [Paenarthrobacter sp. CCNWLY172]|uniref:SHOCT domain-containing protein n=1 Tax=unclassified Paenarthrobacter TaxID=2634190 RepID=UPI0030782E57